MTVVPPAEGAKGLIRVCEGGLSRWCRGLIGQPGVREAAHRRSIGLWSPLPLRVANVRLEVWTLAALVIPISTLLQCQPQE